MPWRECSKMDQKEDFVEEALGDDANKSAVCRAYNVSRTTGYKWLRRYLENRSLLDLGDRSRRPHSSPNRTPAEVEAKVVELRQAEGWGARKLRHLLLAEGIELSESTINRIIKRKGLIRDRDVHRPALKRFEFEAPNDLWQIDFKGPIRLAGKGRCHPMSILDDHSRYLVGLIALPSIRAELVLSSLVHVFTIFGLPKAILTDHGVPFWGTTSPFGLTTVNVAMSNQGIVHLVSGIRHPQTQGKVERLHRTLQQSMNHHGTPRTMGDCNAFFARFREVYNHDRPHEALGMDVPASRYHPSADRYQHPAPEYDYPEQMTVRRLNTQGCLDYEGQRLFVCEALAQQNVGLHEFDGQLYIHFRDNIIRQIDRATLVGRRPQG